MAKQKAKRPMKRKKNTLSLPVDTIKRYFQTLPDPRAVKNRRHLLSEIMVIAICGLLASCNSFSAFEKYGKRKEKWLRKFLELPNGIPSHDTFTRVFGSLESKAFQRCFDRWLVHLQNRKMKDEKGAVFMAIDGKTLRRSHDRTKDLGPLHLVSIWACEGHLSLGQVAVPEKSNEITAIPELLEMVDISGATITIDAMGCQKAIVKKIRSKQANYVLALKGNQETLHDQTISFVVAQLELEAPSVAYEHHETNERGHGRQEHRVYYQFELPPEMQCFESDWQDLKTIGVVIDTRTIKGQEQFDVRYYISNLSLDVKQFAKAVRGHWRIENTLHWILDMTFDEDRCRIRKQSNAVENLAYMRRIALSLLKQHPSKDSVNLKRQQAGWDNDFLLEVLLGQG